MYINKNSYITFDGNSGVNFTENSATASGAVDIFNGSIVFSNSTVIFDNNSGTDGTAIHGNANCEITIRENSTVIFSNHWGLIGGAIHCLFSCRLIYNESTVTFINNKARYGGAISVQFNFNMIIAKDAKVTFNNNSAVLVSGAIHIADGSNIICGANSNVIFILILQRMMVEQCF